MSKVLTIQKSLIKIKDFPCTTRQSCAESDKRWSELCRAFGFNPDITNAIYAKATNYTEDD